MLIVLSTPTFDPDGYIELQATDDFNVGPTRRRMNRIATIDGGAVFNDFGVSEADRTIDVTWAATSAATDAAVLRLVQTYAQIIVATPGGVFLAAPDTFTPGATESTLTLQVAEKLSA